jgi:hypothetical protein
MEQQSILILLVDSTRISIVILFISPEEGRYK